VRIIECEKKGKTIQSPWFRPADAAAYCGLSRTEFDCRAKALPHAGKYRLKVYHQNVLDKWLTGELGIPFDPIEKPITKRFQKTGTVIGITHPRTGKFAPCPQL
jgi:hypothetical protein